MNTKSRAYHTEVDKRLLRACRNQTTASVQASNRIVPRYDKAMNTGYKRMDPKSNVIFGANIRFSAENNTRYTLLLLKVKARAFLEGQVLGAATLL